MNSICQKVLKFGNFDSFNNLSTALALPNNRVFYKHNVQNNVLMRPQFVRFLDKCLKPLSQVVQSHPILSTLLIVSIIFVIGISLILISLMIVTYFLRHFTKSTFFFSETFSLGLMLLLFFFFTVCFLEETKYEKQTNTF